MNTLCDISIARNVDGDAQEITIIPYYQSVHVHTSLYNLLSSFRSASRNSVKLAQMLHSLLCVEHNVFSAVFSNATVHSCQTQILVRQLEVYVH
jgi:hypothetical protein